MNHLQVITRGKAMRMVQLKQIEMDSISGGWLRPNWPVALLELFTKCWEFGRDLYHRNCDHD